MIDRIKVFFLIKSESIKVINLYKNSFKSEKASKFLKVFGTASLSQVLSILSVPILAKLYSPNYFGEYESFMAVYSIIFIISTLQLEKALLTAKKKDLNNIFSLVVASLGVYSISYWILISLLNYISEVLTLRHVAPDSFQLYLTVLLGSLFSTCQHLVLRFKLIGYLIVDRLIKPLVFLLAAITLNFFGDFGSNNLIISEIISLFACISILASSPSLKIRYFLSNVDLSLIKDSFKAQINFVRFIFPSSLMLELTKGLPLIILYSRFGSSAAGYFAMSSRILGKIINPFLYSATNLFKMWSIEELSLSGTIYKSFRWIFRKQIFMAFVLFCFTILFFPALVDPFLGSNWAGVSTFVLIMSPLYFFNMAVGPLTYVLVIGNAHRTEFFLSVAMTVFAISLTCLASITGFSLLQVVAIYSAIISIMYLVYFFFSLRLARSYSVDRYSL